MSIIEGVSNTYEPDDTYEKRLSDEITRSSELPGYDTGGGAKSDIWWAEWQARELAPRFRMPATQTRKMIKQLIDKYSAQNRYTEGELYRKVICDISSFYGVSKQSAKIRLLELGYDGASGAMNYVDGAYIPPYTLSRGSTPYGKSYDINVTDAGRLYDSDPLFASVVDSGDFIYAEGHYCTPLRGRCTRCPRARSSSSALPC